MNVCILIDAWEPVWGGGQTHVWEIAKRIAQYKQWHMDIYTRALKNQHGQRFDQTENFFDAKLRVIRIGPVGQFFSIVHRLAWLITVMFAVVRRHHTTPYDLIHAHAYVAGIPGKLLSKLLNVPVVYTVHGSNHLDQDTYTITAQIEQMLLTRISYDAQISVSRHFLRYGNVNKNITVIPNGVTTTVFDNAVIDRVDNMFIILWVGRFDKVKNVDILIKAFAKYHKLNTKSILHLVGTGAEERTIKKFVQKQSLGHQVKFFGKISQRLMPSIYVQADVFVLPSKSEGFALTLLEACAARLPVIATAVGDNSSLVKNGKNGYLIKPDDIGALVAALRKVEQGNREKMGAYGYTIAKQYSWELAAKKTLQIYEKVTAPKA